MKKKYRNAIVRAIEATGYEVLEKDYDGFIVCAKDDVIMFSEPQIHIGEIIEDVEVQHKRFDFEKASCMYFANNDIDGDRAVTFNVAQLFILSSSRGMLRHVVNWPNSTNINCEWNIIMPEGSE